MVQNYDFAGWATRNNLPCADGRTIRRGAFKHQDGEKVPLVWNHQHNSAENVLGHAILENRNSGVYTYGFFNDTESGRNARMLVESGDIESLSILANKLEQNGGDVLHGDIKEVSLVLAGANPGAYIEDVITHGDIQEGIAIIYSDDVLIHGDDIENRVPTLKELRNMEEDTMAHSAATEDMTIPEIFDTLDDIQKEAVYRIMTTALEDDEDYDEDEEEYDEDEDEDYDEDEDEDYDEDEELEQTDDFKGDDVMKHNVFDQDVYEVSDTLTHAEMMEVFDDAKRYGSLKDSVLAHGIEQIDYLFPQEKNLNVPPSFIQRDMGWVQKVMSSVRHTPFSRIRSTFADITEDDARAKGYIKGKMKKEEVFSLLKRSTTPTTIYKKQKLDRDDVVDITDFDVVSWLKTEMRMMLDEELARAFLIGDGRLTSSDDKINEQNIRPIWTDADLYTIKVPVNIATGATDTERAKAIIRAAIKSRKNYKGSGEPSFYTTEDVLTDMLLIEDNNGRVIYDSVEKLRNTLRVKEIVTVPVMENAKRTDSDSKERTLIGLIVNLTDYNVGADKGGAVNMFDDFDIDYNAQKYLIETRCSGAMIKPYAAIALELVGGAVNPS